MRSAVHTTFGEPPEVLMLADSPVPEPGPGQVRVKTVLSPIHNHDLWTVRGKYGYKPELPAIGGSEAVGFIDALGEGVDGPAVGTRVVVASVHGTWAEYFLAPAKAVVPVPDTIEDGVAAQLIAMPMSALLLLEFLQLREGQWLIQNAANGAVGKTLAMLAKARGLHVINLVRRDSAVEEMTSLGIDHVISTAHAGWREQVRAITGPSFIRAGIDSVGGAASGRMMSLLCEGGVLVAFGTMAGEPMQISAGELIFKQAVVKGFWGSKASRALSREDKRRLMEELLHRVGSGEVKLPVEAIFDLADVAQAAAASLQSGRKGKVLLRA